MKHAFSLVELSIVLVILGLLTGGILTGQALIRAAELRSITTEFQRYQTAVQTFRDKYRSLPGDMRDATRFWGRSSSDGWCVTNSAAAVQATGTCDGNGNGEIVIEAPTSSQSSEGFQFWRHMALAGLIEGNYSGLAGVGGWTHHIPGTNSPLAKIPNTSWGINYRLNFAGTPITYAMNYGNYFFFGRLVSDAAPNERVLSPDEAWNIDLKIDDGRPARGKVIAMYWNNECAAADDGTHANNDLDASYRLSDVSVQCSLIFRELF